MKSVRGYVDTVQRRRDELCFLVWGIAWAIAMVRAGREAGFGGRTVHLLGWEPLGLSGACAGLVLLGVGLRVWAAGNLEKNRFTKPCGPYRIVRHPLYAGTLLISLGFLLSLGQPVTGLLAWVVLVFGIFLPVLRKEERELAAKFPGAYKPYLNAVPALLPRLTAVPAAVASSRFRLTRASVNYGTRALWFLLVVPALNLAVVMRAGGKP